MVSTSNRLQREGRPALLLSSSETNNHQSAISRTEFEDLSAELILLMFGFFWKEPDILYQAFYNLNSRLNTILRQMKYEITELNNSLFPHPIDYAQIKSVHIKVDRERRHTLGLLEHVFPERIVSLEILVAHAHLLIRPVISVLRNFSRLKTFKITVGLLSKELEQELYQAIRQLRFLKSYSIRTVGNFPLSPVLEPFPFSVTIVNLTTHFMDLTKLDKLYAALPNLKRLAMRPYIGESENFTNEAAINPIPPPSLEYLRLHLVNRDILPLKCIELLLRTFPLAQLQYLSILEESIEDYHTTDVWFSILTVPTLKPKQLRIKLVSEETTIRLIQQLRPYSGNTTQIIQLPRNPHTES